MQQAINRAFDIIEYVGKETENPSSFSEIAKAVNLNTGTCANIINALVKRGYLEKLEEKKGYLLGKKLYQLTNFDGYNKDLLKIASPILEKLTEKFNENCSLAVLKGSSRILLHQTKSQQEIQATSAVDKSAYDSSTGRLLIAMQTDSEIERFVMAYGLPNAIKWKEGSTKKNLLKEVENIRKNGYSIQESEQHISGIAVGVYRGDKVVGAICLFLPSFRLPFLNRQELIDGLKEAASQIGRALRA